MKFAIAAALALVLAAPAASFAQGGPPGSPEDMIKMMDANKDGKVTKDETSQMPPGVFDSMDTNKDGVITAEELKNAPMPQGPPPQQ